MQSSLSLARRQADAATLPRRHDRLQPRNAPLHEALGPCDGLARWFNEAMALSSDPLTGVTWEWAPPQRELLDPSREVAPMVQMVRAGFKSQSQMIRETGYEADDVLEKVMGWLRAASERNVAVEDFALVHPRRELTPDDLKRTLQGLGLWPSATLKLRGDAVPPPPPPRPSNKPKPSDIFKKIKMARKRAEREERYRSAPAPA